MATQVVTAKIEEALVSVYQVPEDKLLVPDQCRLIPGLPVRLTPVNMQS